MSPRDIVEVWLSKAIVIYFVATYEERMLREMFPRASGEVRNLARGL